MTPELRDAVNAIKEYIDLKVDPLAERVSKIEHHLEQLNGSKVKHAERLSSLEAKQGRVSVATIIAAAGLLSSTILGIVQFFGH